MNNRAPKWKYNPLCYGQYLEEKKLNFTYEGCRQVEIVLGLLKLFGRKCVFV